MTNFVRIASVLALALTLVSPALGADILGQWERSRRVDFDPLSANGSTNWQHVRGGRGGFMHNHTVQIIALYLPATCTFNLEGSMMNGSEVDEDDDVLSIVGHSISGDQPCTANSMFHVDQRPVERVRGTVTSLTGTAATITDCTNATPIVVTTSAAHGFSNGFKVTITGVTGNTACNVTDTEIGAVTSTTFELTGVAGSGAYIAGGTATTVPRVKVIYSGSSF